MSQQQSAVIKAQIGIADQLNPDSHESPGHPLIQQISPSHRPHAVAAPATSKRTCRRRGTPNPLKL
jgi:hypothetical protein